MFVHLSSSLPVSLMILSPDFRVIHCPVFRASVAKFVRFAEKNSPTLPNVRDIWLCTQVIAKYCLSAYDRVCQES
jgi:hypothetical protein